MCKVLIIRWLPATGRELWGGEKGQRPAQRPGARLAARPRFTGVPNGAAHKPPHPPPAHKPAKALAVLLGLFGDEGVEHAGLEVVDLHGALHLGKGLGCDLAGGF